MIHELKIRNSFFEDVIAGRKTFEIRKNDREYQDGDFLALNEVDTEGKYTGRSTLAYVDYVFFDEEFCKDGYCTMGIKPAVVWKRLRPYNERDMTFDYKFQELRRDV